MIPLIGLDTQSSLLQLFLSDLFLLLTFIIAEKRRTQVGTFLQDVGRLFRSFHPGGKSITFGSTSQMFTGCQSTHLCVTTRHEPRK